MGNRMEDVQPGAMSMHEPTSATRCSRGFLNLLFRTPVRDAHCGMRALRRDVLPALALQATGMEFASEMVIRAARGEPRDPRVADRAPSARGRVEALALQGRLAPSAADARLPPELPLPRSRERSSVRSDALLMALVFAHASLFGHTFLDPHADRRLAARRRRHAARRLRPLRPVLRRATSSATATPGSSGWAAASGSSTGSCSALASIARRPRRSAASSSVTGSPAASAASPRSELTILAATLVDRRRPGLLHLVPALAARPAPPRPRRRLSLNPGSAAQRRPGSLREPRS